MRHPEPWDPAPDEDQKPIGFQKPGFKADKKVCSGIPLCCQWRQTVRYLLWKQEDADADHNFPDQLEVADEGVLVYLQLPTRVSTH